VQKHVTLFRFRYLAAVLLPFAVASAATAQGPSTGSGQAYPAKPVRAIVPWPPGGASDVVGRIVGQKLGESLGQQVVIDNRGGANGAIGAALAAKAVPDGYTLLVGGQSELVLNPQISKVPYDTLRDFVPVSALALGYFILVTHPSLPATSVKSLVALAKAHPGQIHYASGGTGSNLSLVAELFKSTAGVDIAHIPYKGGGPAGVAVLSGESQMMFSTIAATLPYVQSKRMRALAVTGTRRAPQLRDVPTFAESGVRGMDVGIWFALLVPAATPREIVARLNAEVLKFGAAPDYRAQLDKVGFEPFTGSSGQCAEFLRSELARWGKVIKAADIRAE
jgi:tripartite-type tricarboxylate transporter receptor subunit TctC